MRAGFTFGAVALVLASIAFTSVARADSTDPVTEVWPLIGTANSGDTFPGADVPFGMVQWSPDGPHRNPGGGYDYADTAITGFSLTHLSGAGCSIFGDFAILPATGDVVHPESAKQPFTHANETASPGWYAVTVGDPGIRVELTTSRRTGMARLTFPPVAKADVLIDAASNQAGVTAAHVTVDSQTQISGWASSGFFCGMPNQYKVYFVAQFDRPFVTSVPWSSNGLTVTFDATANQIVRMKVGLSFVSAAGALANLDAESPGWDVDAVATVARASWHAMLSRVTVGGGTPSERRTFYTALYHTMLHPNVISDEDGSYMGFDGALHRSRAGHDEYANISDWDIYRTEMPLLAVLAPAQAGDMIQSLVDAASQEGWLPRVAIVNAPTSVMGGDSVDPVIASAYAFGARGFDARSALAAMVKGATTTAGQPAQGWYLPRWELDDKYKQQGYVVNTHRTSIAVGPNGASETLEYAFDDFSIAQLARSLGQPALAATFLARSSNWATLFDTTTKSIQPRDEDGAFMDAPVDEFGQDGFQEGNAAQYTWFVPHDGAALIDAFGGRSASVARLDAFFTQLNAGPSRPYAWLGNEICLGIPWFYLQAGAPWRAQAVIRRAMSSLYGDRPDGIPGNDDLGTMSAWYVWNAIGLYPQNSAAGVLDIGSPLFESVHITQPDGSTLVDIHATDAGDNDPYIRSLRVNGVPSQRTWLSAPLRSPLRLDFDLSRTPNTGWGTAANDVPPSFRPGALHFAPSTSARLIAPDRATLLTADAVGRSTFRIDNGGAGSDVRVRWSVEAPPGLRVAPPNGTLRVGAHASAGVALTLSGDKALLGRGYYAVRIAATSGNGAPLQHATLIVRSDGGPAHPIAYVEKQFGNAVTPIDLVTGALGPDVTSGGVSAGDAAVSPDGAFLYVANRVSATVSKIDRSTGGVIANVGVGYGPNAVMVTPDGRTIWVANIVDGTIQSVDAATMRAALPIPAGPNPNAIVLSPDAASVYVLNAAVGTVTVVDPATRTVRRTFAVGVKDTSMALAGDGRMLYLTNAATNRLDVVDTADGRTIDSIPVGVYPAQVAISPSQALALVSNYANSTVTPVDLRTNKPLAPVEVGGSPAGIAFTRDGKYAIAISRRDNLCTILELASGQRRSTLLSRDAPYGVAAP